MTKLHHGKEVKTMTYETPAMTVLTPAINAIQAVPKVCDQNPDGPFECINAYEDWE